MLITCTSCAAKMRVPETAAGKRVKCPKCATILSVPEADAAAETPKEEPLSTGVSSSPLPPQPAAEPEPEEKVEESGTEVTATPPPSSSGVKPPPIQAAKKRPSAYDDGDDDDDDDGPPERKRRRDDDDLDLTRGRNEPTNGLATTSMILGIIAVSFGAIGLCCCSILFEPLAALLGSLAILFGFLGKSPGSEGPANTGIICGIAALALAVAGFLLVIFVFGMQLGFGAWQQNVNRNRRGF